MVIKASAPGPFPSHSPPGWTRDPTTSRDNNLYRFQPGPNNNKSKKLAGLVPCAEFCPTSE